MTVKETLTGKSPKYPKLSDMLKKEEPEKNDERTKLSKDLDQKIEKFAFRLNDVVESYRHHY